MKLLFKTLVTDGSRFFQDGTITWSLWNFINGRIPSIRLELMAFCSSFYSMFIKRVDKLVFLIKSWWLCLEVSIRDWREGLFEITLRVLFCSSGACFKKAVCRMLEAAHDRSLEWTASFECFLTKSSSKMLFVALSLETFSSFCVVWAYIPRTRLVLCESKSVVWELMPLGNYSAAGFELALVRAPRPLLFLIWILRHSSGRLSAGSYMSELARNIWDAALLGYSHSRLEFCSLAAGFYWILSRLDVQVIKLTLNAFSFFGTVASSVSSLMPTSTSLPASTPALLIYL